MTAHLNRDNDHRVAGTIKFKKEIKINVLIKIISDLKRRDPARWIDLHVRSAGMDGTYYIALHCSVEDETEAAKRSFVHALVDYLTEVLGRGTNNRPNGVIGWSINSVELVA